MTHLQKLFLNLIILNFFEQIFSIKHGTDEKPTVEYKLTEKFRKCQHGKLSTHKKWDQTSPLYIEYDPYSRIACIEVLNGKTSTLSGGLMDTKIDLKCLTKNCEIKIYTRLSKKCNNSQITEEHIWTEKNLFKLNFTPEYIISCLKVMGTYEIISGGIGFHFATLRCLSSKCNAQIFKQPFQKCEVGVPIVIQSWNVSQDFKFENSDIKIVCKEVLGRFEFIANLEENHLRLRCYSPYCKVTLYANETYENNCSYVGYNFTDTLEPGTSFNLNFKEKNMISCFYVDGPYELLSGGIGQDVLSLNCLSEKICSLTYNLKYLYETTSPSTIFQNSSNTKLTTSLKQLRVRHSYKEFNIPIIDHDLKNLIETTNKYFQEDIQDFFVPKIEAQTVHESCENFKIEANSTWNSLLPLYIRSSKEIACVNGHGPYTILSGGIGFNSITAICGTLCYLEIYTISEDSILQDCSNHSLYIIKNWTSHLPLVVNMLERITCFQVDGVYTIISGGVGELSLVAECLSDMGCKVTIYVNRHSKNEKWQYCKGYRLYLRKQWSSFGPLTVNLTNDMKIDCLKVDGNYSIISGGNKSNFLAVKCTSNNCTLEIYVGKKISSYISLSQVDECEGKHIETKCWDKTKTIARHLTQSDHAIFCTNISGEHNVLAGGIGESFLEIECLELAKDCCVSIFSRSIFRMAAMNSIYSSDNANEESLINFNCSYGYPETSLSFKFGVVEKITLAEQERISCLSGIGSYQFRRGGIGSNAIELECMSQEGCIIEIFSVKSCAPKIIFLKFWAFSFLLNVI